MISITIYQEEIPDRCSSWELPEATGDISLLKFLCYMCCLLVYLHFVDCHHVLLSTPSHSLGFVPTNHRQLSLSIFDQLCDWMWSHLLGKNFKVHSPSVKIPFSMKPCRMLSLFQVHSSCLSPCGKMLVGPVEGAREGFPPPHDLGLWQENINIKDIFWEPFRNYDRDARKS